MTIRKPHKPMKPVKAWALVNSKRELILFSQYPTTFFGHSFTDRIAHVLITEIPSKKRARVK